MTMSIFDINSYSNISESLDNIYQSLNENNMFLGKHNIFNMINLFNDAIDDFNNADYKNAINKFDFILKELPNQGAVLYYKSLSFGALGEYEKAIQLMNKAIEINPHDYRFWNDKGSFLVQINDIDEAIVCFDESIKINSNSCNWSNEAILFHKIGELQKSNFCYDEAIKLNPLDVFPVIGKAKLYMDVGDFDLASKYFKLAGEIDSNDLGYLIEFGKFLMYLKDFKTAVKYFDKCLKFNDNLPFVWMFKAMALNHLTQYDEANKCVDRAIELDSLILSKFDELFGNIF